jgi:hypothetical protein
VVGAYDRGRRPVFVCDNINLRYEPAPCGLSWFFGPLVSEKISFESDDPDAKEPIYRRTDRALRQQT